MTPMAQPDLEAVFFGYPSVRIPAINVMGFCPVIGAAKVAPIFVLQDAFYLDHSLSICASKILICNL